MKSNLTFAEDYFQDEIRDGFYVSPLMKRAWAAQLEVLSEVARVCEKHQIEWFVDCGTLLGAVRHGGFIPWDDDLDICMMRDEYNRFNKIARKELPEGYVVMDYHDEDCWELLLRVTNGREITMDEKRLSKYHQYPFIAGIDVFPLDFACPNEEEEETRRMLANFALAMSDEESVVNGELTDEAREMIEQIEELCKVKIDPKKPLRLQLYELTVTLFSLYDRHHAKEILLTPYWIAYHDHKYKLEWFKRTVKIPFENMMVPAPAMYDAVLRTEYGDGYMTPVRAGGVHNYPYFIPQEDQLDDAVTGGLPYRYHVTADEVLKRFYALPEPYDKFAEALKKGHEGIAKSVDARDLPAAQGFLTQCQEIAMKLGTMLEERFGEGNPAVKRLEDYCEEIFRIYESLSAGENAGISALEHILALAEEELRSLSKKKTGEKKEIVFLPWKRSTWQSLAPIWEKLSADTDCHAVAVPIPYYDKKMDTSHGAEHFDDAYPPEVEVVRYDAYDFAARRPDTIYFNYPYDGCNYATAIHPFFYSSNLKQFTDDLVYVPWFVMDEIGSDDQRGYQTMNYFARMPGLVFSDRVLLQSEQMRERYIENLTEFAGAETREVWEKKLIALKKPLFDPAVRPVGEIPEEWKPLILRPDGTRKKVMLYRTTASILLEHRDLAIQKIEESFRTFQSHQENVALIWRPQENIENIVRPVSADLAKKYRALSDLFEREGFGIYDGTPSPSTALSLSDAYYGDPDSLVQYFRAHKLPVMLADPTVRGD